MVLHPRSGWEEGENPIQLTRGTLSFLTRGRTPSQVQMGRYLRSGQGGTPSFLTGGYPIPGPDMGGGAGVPHPAEWGSPSFLTRRGYLIPHLDWGVPHPVLDGDGGTPSFLMGVSPHPPGQKTEQHSEHLLRGGRYAFCVHAGGLFCFKFAYYFIVTVLLVWKTAW